MVSKDRYVHVMIKASKKCPSFVFEMKDMGEVRHVPVVKVIKNLLKKLLVLS